MASEWSPDGVLIQRYGVPSTTHGRNVNASMEPPAVPRRQKLILGTPFKGAIRTPFVWLEGSLSKRIGVPFELIDLGHLLGVQDDAAKTTFTTLINFLASNLVSERGDQIA